jgi:hypothetical protein
MDEGGRVTAGVVSGPVRVGRAGEVGSLNGTCAGFNRRRRTPGVVPVAVVGHVLDCVVGMQTDDFPFEGKRCARRLWQAL